MEDDVQMEYNIGRTVSGPIHKSSVSEDSSSDVMDLDDSVDLADPYIEQNLRRLKEEERVLLEKQVAMEAGPFDDFAALEHQDLLRHNQLQQLALQRRQATLARRLALRQARLHGAEYGRALAVSLVHGVYAPSAARRRHTCNVRVNHLHAAEAYETDV